MQRWLKLPDGRYIDGDRVLVIGKVESFARLDEGGNDLGTGYSVLIGTDFPREQQIAVVGTKDEIHGFLKNLLVGCTTAATQAA